MTPRRNHLLKCLSAADLELLGPALERVELPLRLVLETPGQPVRHVHFPESGFVSVVAGAQGARVIEVGMIGWEGMTGLGVVLGDSHAVHETFVQSAGWGWRIPTEALRTALDASPTLRTGLLHYVQAFLCQVSQTALTNGRALMEERLARWLLMAHDRLQGDELPLTHEFIALMLGVRRSGVTVILHQLEGRRLIKSTRGLVEVLDRAGLEAAAGGSYGVSEAEYVRLFGLHPNAMSA